MDASPDVVRRMFGWLGVLAWLLVGVPIAVAHGLAHAPLVWIVAFVGFGAAFWLASRASGTDGRLRRIGLPGLQVLCAVVMVLVLCDGLEGLLLCLVAFQLGRWSRPRFGVTWIVAQSVLSSGAMAIHWTLGAALMLGPPYFGFQLLAYASAYLIERVADGRAERARLAERVRLSRELHDIAGHRLTALSLNLQVLQRTAPAALRERIDAAHTLADDLLAEVRHTVEAFRREPAPAEQAIRALGDRIPRPRVHVTYRDDLAIDDPELANTVLRCVQEIVTNAARHANADNLWIDVTSSNDVCAVRARDDGCGIDRLIEGNGLRGMRERLAELGGELHIESRAGAGTVLDARIPLRHPS
jgi:signal transduction histidine kinase